MLHMMAYQASVPDVSVYADLTPIPDQATVVQNGKFFFQEDRRVVLAGASGAGMLAARITSPGMLMTAYPEVWPFSTTNTLPSFPQAAVFGDYGPWCRLNDQIGFQVSQTSGGASQCYAAVFTDRDKQPAPLGQVFTLRGTAAITGVTSSWVSGPITFTQQVPAGKYAVTGMDAWGTNALYMRLIFPNQPTRPGCFCGNANTTQRMPYFRYGGLGLLGTFYTYAPPQLEVMQSGANTAQTVLIDIVKIGDA